MRIANIAAKMIEISQGNLHDIEHFLKVHAYARLIGQLEQLAPDRQFILEAAALLHDIACPLCRQTYGHTHGKQQELLGMPLAQEFLSTFDLPAETVERIVFLVGHHHTLTEVDGPDYQILLEADYLVNASESSDSPAKLRHAQQALFRTQSGLALFRSVYGIDA